MEKSVNTANNTSLFFVEHHKKKTSRDYSQWTQTAIYKQHKLQEKIIQGSLMQNKFEVNKLKQRAMMSQTM